MTAALLVIVAFSIFIAYFFYKKYLILYKFANNLKSILNDSLDNSDEILKENECLLNKIKELEENAISIHSLLLKQNKDFKTFENFILFSYRTILRSLYIQLSSNPASIIASQHSILLIESALIQIDAEWFKEVQDAYFSAQNGDSKKISKIVKRAAQDLSLIRPLKEGELAN